MGERGREREWVFPVWEASWRAREIGEQGWQVVLTVEMGLSSAVLVPRVVEKEERALERLGMMAVHR